MITLTKDEKMFGKAIWSSRNVLVMMQFAHSQATSNLFLEQKINKSEIYFVWFIYIYIYISYIS